MSDSPLSMNLYAEDWLKRPLIKVSEFIKDGTHGTHERVNIGFPLLSAKNITSYGSITIDKEDSRISNDDYQKIHSKYEIQKNDLLITVVGTLGRRALADGVHKFSIQRSVGVVRCDTTKIFPKFLYHFTGSDYFQNQLTLRSNATAQAGVYLGELAKIDIAIPPLPEQQKIATILTSVDTVIENTRAQIDKLKHLKTAMMQELLTKGIGHTEFKDSPVGKIPKEWEVKNLADISKSIQTGPFGSQLHSHEYIEWGVPVIMPKDMKSNKVDPTSVAHIPLDKAKELSKHKAKAGDIVFARRGDIGRFALMGKTNEGWICGTGCLKVSLQGSVNPEFLASYLTLESVIEWLNINAVGQTMLNLNTSILAELPIVLPPESEQAIIGETIASLDSNIELKGDKLLGLEKTKKALMQDLLTGKVRVFENKIE